MKKQGFILGLDQLLPASEEQESIPGTAWAGEVPAAGCSHCVQSCPPSVSLLDVCCGIPALWLDQALLSLLEPRAPAEDGSLGAEAVPCWMFRTVTCSFGDLGENVVLLGDTVLPPVY